MRDVLRSAACFVCLIVTAFVLNTCRNILDTEEKMLAKIEALELDLLTEKRDRLCEDIRHANQIELHHQQLRVLNMLMAHQPTPPGSPFPHITVDRANESMMIPPQNLPVKPKE